MFRYRQVLGGWAAGDSDRDALDEPSRRYLPLRALAMRQLFLRSA